jgi:hypothetical protein
MSAPLHTVHVRVNDAATGRPTPVRIRFTDENGEYYAPFGRTPSVPADCRLDSQGGSVLLDGELFAYIDGMCEVALPPTPITIQVYKGPEYIPIRRSVTLGPGKLAIRVEIERGADLRDRGWYSGDIGALAPSPHAALLEGAAEDLSVINLLAYEAVGKTGLKLYPNLLAFSGQRPALEMPHCMVVVNTYNCHPSLGSLNLLNCHRTVYPLTFGGGGPDNWTLSDWCDQCHRKGGLAAWRQAARCGDLLGEALADLVLGKVDALEIESHDGCFNTELYYTLLNAGLKVVVVAGSRKTGMQVLGSARSYALIASADFDYAAWIEAVRAGRTFVTSGPLLLFTVDGQYPGAVVDPPSREEPLRVHAEAVGWSPFDRVELVANGEVVAARPAREQKPVFLEANVVLREGGWLAARCVSGNDVNSSAMSLVRAHTSPVYVRINGRPSPVNRDAAQRLREALDRMLRWVNTEGRFENDRQKSNLIDIFLSAKEKLRVKGPSQ